MRAGVRPIFSKADTVVVKVFELLSEDIWIGVWVSPEMILTLINSKKMW